MKCKDGATECLEMELVGEKAELDAASTSTGTTDYTTDPACK